MFHDNDENALNKIKSDFLTALFSFKALTEKTAKEMYQMLKKSVVWNFLDNTSIALFTVSASASVLIKATATKCKSDQSVFSESQTFKKQKNTAAKKEKVTD